MIKNYIYALALSCATTVAFAQKDVTLGIAGAAPTVDGIMDALYTDPLNMPMQNITNCIVASKACGGIIPATNCVTVAKWTAVYDNAAIYIFASVIDANKEANDKIELFLSMDNDRTSNCPLDWPRAYNANTFQLELNEAALGALKVNSPNGQSSTVESAISVVTATGYDVEVKLIFSEMDFLSGLTPVAGRKIGFDIANNDFVGPTGDDKNQLYWNACCNNRNWTEATNFGIITLGAVVLDNGVGTNKLTSLINKVSVFPNPAANEVNVKINAKDNDNVNVSIINSLSQKVYTSNEAIGAGENLKTISTANLANGIYTVVISKGNLNTTEMVVINK